MVKAYAPLSGAALTAKCREMADKWLCGWGRVVLEREQSRNPSAIPREEWFDSKGSRCIPSSLPSIIDAYLDVERFLAARDQGVRRMLDWHYVRNWNERVLWRKWLFGDGTWQILKDGEPDPVIGAAVQHVESVRYIKCDWEAFLRREAKSGHLDPEKCKIEQYGLGWARIYEFTFRSLQLALSDDLSLDIRVQEQHQIDMARKPKDAA